LEIGISIVESEASRRRMRFWRFVVLLPLSAPLAAATLTVDVKGGAMYDSIQPAIDAAQAGDTVLVKSGDYIVTDPITFKGKDISVSAQDGPDQTTIRMAAAPAAPNRAAVVVFEEGETAASLLEGFRLTGGRGMVADGSSLSRGGGVSCTGASPTIAHCRIAGNEAHYGGGVDCDTGSAPTIADCAIVENSAYQGGAVFSWYATPTITNSTIAGNSAYRDGGVSCWFSPLTLTSCIVWQNAGGALGAYDTQALVTYSCVESGSVLPGTGNLATDPRFCGWGNRTEVFVDASALSTGDGTSASPYKTIDEALVYNVMLSPTSPCRGTGLDGVDMGAPLGMCDTAGSTARRIRIAAGTYVVRNLILVRNVSLAGAGSEQTILEGTLWGLRTKTRVSDLMVTKGTLGGIVVPRGESPEITHCTITENTTGNDGGGICASEHSAPVIVGCTISRNRSAVGAGIYCGESSSPVLAECMVAENTATGVDTPFGPGGGVYCASSSTVTLTNSAIIGNSGSGVYCWQASVTMTNVTLTENRAGEGGGVFCRFSSPELTNCIVWNNAGGSFGGEGHENALVSFSCIEHHDVWPGEGTIRDDPQFVAAGHWDDRGTPDDPGDDVWSQGDYRLSAASPCIDRGVAQDSLLTDLDGFARSCGDGVDMGAYEAGACPAVLPRFIRGDSNGDGSVNIADAAHTLVYLFARGTPAACLDTADANDGGSVDIADAIALLYYLFGAGESLPEPYDACGLDPSLDNLGCLSYPPCAGG
jgi:hypothetical protein